tara:strand:- start:1064 stop:1294 length:231 start_codon:yes stop_codon:yes gene_type:complete
MSYFAQQHAADKLNTETVRINALIVKLAAAYNAQDLSLAGEAFDNANEIREVRDNATSDAARLQAVHALRAGGMVD